SKVDVDDTGELVLHLAEGEVRQHKPLIYQYAGEQKLQVSGGYVALGPRTIGFKIDQYDTTRPLIIDPVLVYSTYLGGSGNDQGFAIAVDASGSAYVTGNTLSPDFPTANPIQGSTGNGDAFVTKMNPAGNALVYSTYLGGSATEVSRGIAVDSSNQVF